MLVLVSYRWWAKIFQKMIHVAKKSIRYYGNFVVRPAA